MNEEEKSAPRYEIPADSLLIQRLRENMHLLRQLVEQHEEQKLVYVQQLNQLQKENKKLIRDRHRLEMLYQQARQRIQILEKK